MALVVEPNESLFTTSSGFTNYRGILNLCVILLVLSNARAALENIIKYGILVDPISWVAFLIDSPRHWPCVQICLMLHLFIVTSLITEKLISKQMIGSWLAYTFMATNLLTLISLPPIVTFSYETHPVTASAALMLVSIVFLKLVSYHMMNFWCRDVKRPHGEQARSTRAFIKTYQSPHETFSRKTESATATSEINTSNNNEPSKTNCNGHNGKVRDESSSSSKEAINAKQTREEVNKTSSNGKAKIEDNEALARKLLHDPSVPYPNNLTVANMYYFMFVPTLCYEIEFARTRRVRKHFVLKRSIELIILLQLDLALVQQWIVPTVSNSLVPLRHMQFTHMLERLLKLAIPNHVIWIIWFYLFFHSLLNIVAELTRFADREFYRDWWNSESVYYFWSNWNIPVHKWCARHLYAPLLAMGVSRNLASTAVFFLSAFFHEYLVSVPLKMFRCWAFLGMLLQMPWARFVSMYFNKQYANVAVWISLIIGQPLCILMYYHDYYVINRV